jgi:hypothetical protein
MSDPRLAEPNPIPGEGEEYADTSRKANPVCVVSSRYSSHVVAAREVSPKTESSSDGLLVVPCCDVDDVEKGERRRDRTRSRKGRHDKAGRRKSRRSREALCVFRSVTSWVMTASCSVYFHVSGGWSWFVRMPGIETAGSWNRTRRESIENANKLC